MWYSGYCTSYIDFYTHFKTIYLYNIIQKECNYTCFDFCLLNVIVLYIIKQLNSVNIKYWIVLMSNTLK